MIFYGLHYLGILLIFYSVSADKTKIHLEPSEAIEGYDFDNVTYGKNIMCLFWHSNHDESRMFKTAQWDMLHTQKNWYEIRKCYDLTLTVTI